MKTIRITIALIFLCLLTNSSVLFAQKDITDGVSSAIKSGNSSELSKYFNSNVELSILDKEDVYSKVQAELILKDFFSKNQPILFSVLHKGGKDGSKFAIGNLKTNTGLYRIYFLMKGTADNLLIHQLRIEQGNE